MIMNIFDFTPGQLKRAASIKERIDGLNKQLRGILGAPATSRASPTRNRSMSASVKKKIAATQKARWANLRRAKSATRSVPTVKAKKKTMSPAARAKLSSKSKAYWAAKKKSTKK
jgi:hypothetical protein